MSSQYGREREEGVGGARKHARPAAPPRQRAPASSLAQVNLLAALGIAVEFALHIVHAFVSDTAPGPAPAAAERALAGVGSAVASGICATKLLGVAVRLCPRPRRRRAAAPGPPGAASSDTPGAPCLSARRPLEVSPKWGT